MSALELVFIAKHCFHDLLQCLTFKHQLALVYLPKPPVYSLVVNAIYCYRLPILGAIFFPFYLSIHPLVKLLLFLARTQVLCPFLWNHNFLVITIHPNPLRLRGQ